jgi:hypothetical protein
MQPLRQRVSAGAGWLQWLLNTLHPPSSLDLTQASSSLDLQATLDRHQVEEETLQHQHGAQSVSVVR